MNNNFIFVTFIAQCTLLQPLWTVMPRVGNQQDKVRQI